MTFNIYMEGKVSREDDFYFLRLFHEYGASVSALPYQYQWHDKRLQQVRELIPATVFENTSNQFELQKKLMFWANRSLLSGEAPPVRPMNTVEILKSRRLRETRSTCWTYAVVLNEVYLSFGFRSRMIRCLPMDLRPMDCHCMTMVFSDLYNKWVAFDAAMGTYYTDAEKCPLDVQEIRQILLEGKSLCMPYVPRSTSVNLRWYLCKNMIRFCTYQESAFNIEEPERDRTLYMLNPVRYRMTDKVVPEGEHCLFIKNVYSDTDFWNVFS